MTTGVGCYKLVGFFESGGKTRHRCCRSFFATDRKKESAKTVNVKKAKRKQQEVNGRFVLDRLKKQGQVDGMFLSAFGKKRGVFH